MKKEISTVAKEAITARILAALPELTEVRIGRVNAFAMDSGVKDENGKAVYVEVVVNAKNPDGTKTQGGATRTEPFDFAAAVDRYAEWKKEQDEKAVAPKAAKKSSASPEFTAKMNRIEETIREWVAAEMVDETRYTSTDVKNAVPGLADDSLLDIGRVMARIYGDMVTFDRVTEKGKNYYMKK